MSCFFYMIKQNDFVWKRAFLVVVVFFLKKIPKTRQKNKNKMQNSSAVMSVVFFSLSKYKRRQHIPPDMLNITIKVTTISRSVMFIISDVYK